MQDGEELSDKDKAKKAREDREKKKKQESNALKIKLQDYQVLIVPPLNLT